jgi:hypothetical protein
VGEGAQIPINPPQLPFVLCVYIQEVIEYCRMQARIDPQAGNNHAARFASMQGHTACVALLLRDGRADFAAGMYRVYVCVLTIRLDGSGL